MSLMDFINHQSSSAPDVNGVVESLLAAIRDREYSAAEEIAEEWLHSAEAAKPPRHQEFGSESESSDGVPLEKNSSRPWPEVGELFEVSKSQASSASADCAFQAPPAKENCSSEFTEFAEECFGIDNSCTAETTAAPQASDEPLSGTDSDDQYETSDEKGYQTSDSLPWSGETGYAEGGELAADTAALNRQAIEQQGPDKPSQEHAAGNTTEGSPAQEVAPTEGTQLSKIEATFPQQQGPPVAPLHPLGGQLSMLSWRPPGVDLEELPIELQHVLVYVIEPIYSELISSQSALERSTALTIVHLLWCEALDQISLSKPRDPDLEMLRSVQGCSREREIDRHLRIVDAKFKASELLLKCKAYREQYPSTFRKYKE